MRFVFVESIPEELVDGVLYVSVKYRTVAHRCCCGCGREVNTNLSPNGWQLIFDGRTVSLDPSIGNWSFPCQSHYWIRRNAVIWARQWTKDEIKHTRNMRGAYRDGRVHPQESDIMTDGRDAAPTPSALTRTLDRIGYWWRTVK